MPLPLKTQLLTDRHARLNEFRIGLDWRFYKRWIPERVHIKDNTLTLEGRGNSLGASAPLMFVAGCHSYEIEAEVTVYGDAKAGLCLYYNAQFNVGTGFDKDRRYRYRRDHANGVGKSAGTKQWLRLRNDNHVVTAWWSADGKTWNRETWGQEVSGFNHNTLYDFQSVLPGVFCEGQGFAKFENFKYTEL